MQSTITFHGGAGIVTGSNFLLDSGSLKVLVDCGLAQGTEDAEGINWKPFAYDPQSIAVLVVTHAHIDHVGRIPKLVRDGFRGRIISTHATKSIAGPLLHDAMELTGSFARHHNKEELYDARDIDTALSLWETTFYHEPIALPDGITLELLNSGHILGSAMAKFVRNNKTLIFTGDLGGGNSPLISPAEQPGAVDYLVMESVYGDRTRPEDENRRDLLEDVIENAAARGGTLLIPAFSAERTQDLLFEIRNLMTEKRVPSMPVYLDSPLAERLTRAYEENPDYFAPEVALELKAGKHLFEFPELQYVEHIEDSRRLKEKPNPKIIIAGSGMSTGGRGPEHEKYILPDTTSTVLICGYQAAGALGRRIAEGASEVQIGHDTVPVRCHVEQIYGYSAHMDGEELLEFANSAGRELHEVFVVMGEPASSAMLAQRIRDYLGVRAVMPHAGEKATIDW